MSRASGLPTTATRHQWSEPLEAAFGARLNALGLAPPLALAVSGGGDSMALMHLVAAWTCARRIDPKSIFVLTVDHGLRDGSAGEAAQVAARAAALGLSHECLAWEGPKPSTRLQETARAARYDLMGRWCRERGIGTLLVAHTADDQEETVAMRLMRGSGTAGLAGMSELAPGPHGMRLCRPLLGVRGVELRQWLVARGQSWIEDPSNEDPVYERVRVRRVLAENDNGRDRLIDLSDQAAGARALLNRAADQFLLDGLTLSPAGWGLLDRSVLRAAPCAVARHALSRILTALGGGTYPPRRDSLGDLVKRLIAPGFRGATLAGCVIAPKATDSLIIGRELRNISVLALTAGQEALWDNRFKVTCRRPAEIQPLANLGLDRFAAAEREAIKAALPACVRGSAPMVFFDDGSHVVPFAGVGEGAGVEVRFEAPGPFGRTERGDSGKSQ